MAGTKRGMTPVVFNLAPYWTAWIPLLENDNYGLMICYKPLKAKQGRNHVIGQEFYSPAEAHEFALEWLRAREHEAVSPTDTRPKQIALMRAQGKTLQEIGNELGISRQRVFQIMNGE